MDNILHLIGIAKKAGRLVVGEEPVGSAARGRQARVILLASDAADNTVRRAGHFGEAGNISILATPYTKAELGMAVGRASCAMVAVTDAGLAASLVTKLALADTAKYGEMAGKLGEKAAKVLKRQKEQRQHEKNLQKSSSKPWAATQKSGAQGRIAQKQDGPKQDAAKLDAAKLDGPKQETPKQAAPRKKSPASQRGPVEVTPARGTGMPQRDTARPAEKPAAAEDARPFRPAQKPGATGGAKPYRPAGRSGGFGAKPFHGAGKPGGFGGKPFRSAGKPGAVHITKSAPAGGDDKKGKPTGFQGKGATGPTAAKWEASSDVKKNR